MDFPIEPQDLDWQVVGVEERDMGPETHYAAEVDHPELGRLVWNLWEYPEGVESMRQADASGHEVLKDFSYGLEQLPDHAPNDDDQYSRIEEVVDWFRDHYEDPAERTSYASSEGGYLWDHGGPFDAREEIQENFPDLPEPVLDAAVEEIQRDGIFEWAGGRWYDEEEGSTDEGDGVYSLNDPLPDISSFDVDPDDDEGFDEDEIPPQGPGLAFVFASTGFVEVGAQGGIPPGEEATIAQLRAAALSAADDLIALLEGSNAFASIAAAATQYRAAVATQPMSADLAYAFGVRLENSRARLLDDLGRGDLPPMGLAAGEALDSVLAIHGPMLLSTERGRELVELARNYSQREIDSVEYRAAANSLIEAVREAKNLVSRQAVETLIAANEDVGAGPHQDRSLQVAHSANRNLLIVVGGLAVLALETSITGGFAASEPGMGLSELVRAASNAAWHFMSANMPSLQHFIASSGMSDLTWLSALLRRVRGASR